MTVRSIAVCCDDAGWDEANDHAIEALAHAGRLSAVSVLAQGPVARRWRDAPAGVAVGLHLNLTWRPGEPSAGLGGLIARAYAHRLDATALDARIAEQLQAFESAVGRAPDFVDGHQHVHQLPQVRGALQAALLARYGAAGRPALRVPRTSTWRGGKAQVLNLLGASALGRELARTQWPRNRDFAGAYDFNPGADYRQHMQAWLRTIADGGLIMVHPGSASALEHSAARVAEADYLGGPLWPEDLRANGVVLQPFTADRYR
ncbi:MAG: Chitooligosaccharide deacetylase ChbG [Paracidovorax wautersii]|uniref:Chitooligosaccharide deacetylase ChbG n=1 Tax=Paracidovorax wautersii TaxID=1177982 RepID=A0A7V8JRX1_9BURK|nr:MAG: Chitooligosaccharide deacetylase ChbG [Paracidovorax wautersii]